MTLLPKILAILFFAAIFAAIDVYRRPPQLHVNVNTNLAPPIAPVQTPPIATPVTSPNIITPPVAAPITAPITVPIAPEPLGLELTLEQTKKLFDEGTTFIDARLAREYAAEHIRFALHLDSNELGSPEAATVLAKLPPTQRLVIYCGGGDCHASHNLAIFLQQAGYTSLHIFKDGIPAWKAAGYEISAGETP